MSKLEKKYGAWEYTSKRGIKYSVGEVTSEYNVIIDEFPDVNELFDYEVLVKDALVSYVYGSIERDFTEMKDFIDEIVDEYEKHKRTVKFYTNHCGRDDSDILFSCYIGTEKRVREKSLGISKQYMQKIAKEICDIKKKI